MHPTLSVFIVLFALGLLLTVCSFGVKKGIISSESARKSVHLGMGVICMTFPWLFTEVLPVQILAVVAVLGMSVVRWSRLRANVGSALFSVTRLSFGEILFPIAVAWLFTLYQGSSDSIVLYVIPLLLLTFADTAGAIAGTRIGKLIYNTGSGTKSVEGSVAFFVTAFLCIFSGLYISGLHPVSHILVIAITIAIFITCVEGASGLGIDNLIIPIGSYFLLSYYLELSTDTLWGKAISLIIILLLFISFRKKIELNGAAVLSAGLFIFIAYMLGGIYCLIASFMVFVRHMIAIQRIPVELRNKHSIEAVLAVSLPALSWLTLTRSYSLSQLEGSLFFIVSLAFTISMLYLGTHKFVSNNPLTISQLLVSSVLTILLLSLTYPLIQSISFIAIATVVSLVGSILFHRLRSEECSDLKDWLTLCGITFSSTISLYFIYAYTH